MQPWEVVVTTVLSAGGGAVIVKLFDLFTKRGADVAKASLKERSKQEVKRIELTGNAQTDISRLADRMYTDQRDAQEEINDLYGQVASLQTANNVLRESFDKMRGERDIAITDNKGLVAEITKMIAQAKDLTDRLAKRELDFQLLSLEHEGAKARIANYEEAIAEMKQFIDEMNAEKARLEADLERARTRG